jgi:hypothetical protein
VQESQNSLPLYFILLIPAFFVTIWCLSCWAIARVSGWSLLSKRFTAISEPYGDTKSAGPYFYTVYTRFLCHYSSVIRLVAAQDGLYLSVSFLFRFAHPRLCVPWREIELSQTKLFWRRYIVLTLGAEERIPLRVPERMARKLGLLEGTPQQDRKLLSPFQQK